LSKLRTSEEELFLKCIEERKDKNKEVDSED
jgi:hypothetical protein